MTEKDIMSLEEISKQLQDRRLYVVSDITNLSFPTLKKLARGGNKNYTYKTLKVISDYLRTIK